MRVAEAVVLVLVEVQAVVLVQMAAHQVHLEAQAAEELPMVVHLLKEDPELLIEVAVVAVAEIQLEVQEDQELLSLNMLADNQLLEEQ